MKRLLLLALIFMVILAGGLARPAFGQEQQEIAVFVDGLPVAFDVQPVIQEGRVLVPFRATGEALNVEVAWDGTTRTVIAGDGKNSIRLQIGSRTAYRNGSPIPLDVAPQILNGRTLIPLRFFSEAFGCRVDWDGALKEVRITSPPAAMTVIGFYALGDSKISSWTNLFGKPYPNMQQETRIWWTSWRWAGTAWTKKATS
ncbi:hypothetical protein MOTE_11300 [Moorella thermoacetica]|uniref:Copper amine oxidase-like N-terminal domain-containing protein n=1 Tax=Neomoorella thermoacetica TaxID=1525 RepID=A0A1J5NM50_NEOTH|nr:hypothetical protein MOTE_11300 [Moorella thermoacetica]